MAIERILLVDSDFALQAALQEEFRRKGFDVDCRDDGCDAIEALSRNSYDLVLTEAKLPGASGLEVLAAAADLPVIILSTTCSVEHAVEAMHAGAFYYLAKPCHAAELLALIDRVEQTPALPAPQLPCGVVAQSEAMRQIVEQIKQVAASGASVFLTGETGTGKEVLAQLLHSLSSRAHAPLVGVNCAAIPDTLIDSEFFGHERGSFTGAHAQRIGRFEQAHGGTLLLDEVTEIPTALQPKLLRALQERQFERVGGSAPIEVDVRLVATSNRNLSQAMAEGQFREDLFYRLAVIPIEIPPLRERPEDILPLVEHYLPQLSPQPKVLAPEAADLLLSYPWPGNVRELINILERAAVLSDSETLLPSNLHLKQ